MKPLIDSLENITGVKLSDMLGTRQEFETRRQDELDLQRATDLEELKRDEFYDR